MRRSLAVASVVLMAGCSSGGEEAVPPSPSVEMSSSSASAESHVVPDVAGLDGRQAAAALIEAGYVVDPRWDGARTVSSDLFDATSTEPAAGLPAERGTEVRLNLAAPPVMDHIVEWRTDETVALVVDTTPSPRDAHWLVRSIYGTGLEGAMYVVLVNCSVGGTDAADNRQANGRLAVGERGAQVSGLSAGQSEVEMVPGATCP